MKRLIVSGARSTVPLLKPLSEKYALTIFHGDNVPVFKSMNIPCEPLPVKEGMQEYAWNQAAQLARKANWEKAAMPEDVRPEDWLMGYCVGKWVEHILWIEQLEHAAADGMVGVIVHEDVTRPMKTLCLWAKARGIPSLHVPHGPYGDPDNIDWIHAVSHTDYVACTNHRQEAYFHSFGQMNTRVTGMPEWDKWSHLQIDKRLAQAQMGCPDGKLAVMFLNTFWVGYNDPKLMERAERFYRAMLQAAKKNDWYVLAKAHPSAETNQQHSMEWHAKIAREMGVHVAVSSVAHNLITAQAGDCAIGVSTTELMSEMAIVGIPSTAIVAKPELWPYTWPAAVSDQGDLVEIIEKAVAEMIRPEWKKKNLESLNKNLYDMNHLCDGRATERVLAWIGEMWKSE